jgi:uncharacterized protein YcbK (DUF882 family)
MARRRFLALGAAAIGVGAVTAARAATPDPREIRWLALENSWTGEKLRLTYYANGRYYEQSLGALDRFMRDHVNDSVAEMDVRLYDLLFDLHRATESAQPFLLISGFRSPETNARLAARSRGVARNSYHLRGWAADIRLPGRDLRQLAYAAIALKRGGVGMYSRRSNFIHVDTGPIRKWNI